MIQRRRRRRRKKVFPKFESQSLSTFRTLVQIQRNNKYDESIERFKKFYAKEREREREKENQIFQILKQSRVLETIRSTPITLVISNVHSGHLKEREAAEG